MDKLQEIVSEISSAVSHTPFIIAVDGRCASGKTTLAEKIREQLDCTVIHIDGFFLRPEQRTEERLAAPGGNVDYERFLSEVLLPLKNGIPFSYRPYDCRTKTLAEPVTVTPTEITVIEGSYCCHPELWKYCDLHIFLSIDKETQKKRIIQRNGKMASVFQNMWIPLEEKYFSFFGIREKCEMTFDM